MIPDWVTKIQMPRVVAKKKVKKTNEQTHKQTKKQEQVEVQRKLGSIFQGCLGPGVEGVKDDQRNEENLGGMTKMFSISIASEFVKMHQILYCEKKQFVVCKSLSW